MKEAKNNKQALWWQLRQLEYGDEAKRSYESKVPRAGNPDHNPGTLGEADLILIDYYNGEEF